MRPLNRIMPKLPAGAMKTYQVVAPKASHWRNATCAEVECQAHANGWVTAVDEATELGQRQAGYIRRDSGRAFTERRTPEGGTEFVFPPGQRCFRAHSVPLEREPLYVVRGGDWRGNPSGAPARRHTRPDFWVEDFATHQQALADRLQQG